MASSARIDELKKKFDENPRRYFASLANEYRKAGDLDQALFICQEYLPQQPGHMSGHIVYAQTLYEMGRLEDSKAEFESALALDPENLIALRHLGDIARHAGDFRLARGWYQRVLEADPRNSEIADLLATVRTTPLASAAIPVIPPTPLSTPAAPPSESYTPAPEPASEWPTQTPQQPASPEPEHALFDLEEEALSLGGTPLSSPLVSDSARGGDALETTASSTAEGMPPDHPADSEQPLGAGEFGLDDSFEADAFAIAGAGAPDIELATDLHLGLVDEGAAPSGPDVDASPLEGLHSFEAGVLEKPVDSLDMSLETEPFYDVLNGESESRSPAEAGLESVPSSESSSETPIESATAVAHDETVAVPDVAASDHVQTPSDAVPMARQATPAGSSEIFVTETMAELYLQQGHDEAALDIYRKLLEQQPDDPALNERVRAVEARRRRSTPEAPTEATAASAPGPTIREFLRQVIAGGPRSNGDVESAAPSQGAAADSRETAAASDVSRGSIDALFGGAEPSAADDAVAAALSDAFANADASALDGMPTREASNELSLDQVFKSSTPIRGEAQSGAFSFDQFFAGETSATPPSQSANAGTPADEGADDIAQFNEWLNGLKKT